MAIQQGLCRLVYKEGAEASAGQHTVVAADEGGGDDVGRVEEVGVDLYFQGCGTVAQA